MKDQKHLYLKLQDKLEDLNEKQKDLENDKRDILRNIPMNLQKESEIKEVI